MKPSLAAFDFDCTITRRDTLLPFLIFCFGYSKVLLGLLSLSKILLFYVSGRMPNGRAKEQLFSYFFKGMSSTLFEKLCADFANNLNTLENKKAIKKIEWHLENGHRVVIVSSSIANWIKPWASHKGINDVIATNIEIADQKLTGKFSGSNCYGMEKLRRLKSEFPDLSEIYLYVYGDSRGDRELLSIANEPYYRSF